MLNKRVGFWVSGAWLSRGWKSKYLSEPLFKILGFGEKVRRRPLSRACFLTEREPDNDPHEMAVVWSTPNLWVILLIDHI